MAERLREYAAANPEAAQKLLLHLQRKVVVPHDGGQREIMDSQQRFQIICCGRRFGKTTVAAKKALLKARNRNQMIWWIAPTYKVVKRGYKEVLRQIPESTLRKQPPPESAFDAGRQVVLQFKNGTKMEFYSAERPESMLGDAVDLAIMDEAAIMNQAVWQQYVRPTLIDREGQVTMISTPRGRNWFYYLWEQGQDPEFPDYMSWRFPSSSNPYLPANEMEEMKRELPLLIYQQEVLAEFVASAGAVFRFNPQVIVDPVVAKGHVVVGVDLAKSNDFTVFSAARMEDNMPCGYDRFVDVAWKLQRERLRNFVKQLKKEGATHVTLLIDSGGPGDPLVEEMEADGYDVVPINFTKFKQHMVTQLSKDLETGTVRLDKREAIKEFENYTYTITPAGRWTYGAPDGQHDDCVSAKMLSHWGVVQEGAPNVEAITISMSESERQPVEIPEEDDEVEDFSYLYDEEPDERDGVSFGPPAEPDSPQLIMSRREAWNSAI